MHPRRKVPLAALAALACLLAAPASAQIESDDGDEAQPLNTPAPRRAPPQPTEGSDDARDDEGASDEPSEGGAQEVTGEASGESGRVPRPLPGGEEEAEDQGDEEDEGDEEGEEGEEGEDEEDAPESLDHEFQLGLRAGAGVPFLFALRYGSGPPCDSGGNAFCVLVGSGIVDLDLSFGVTPDLEITTMARIGMIGVEPTAERNLMVGLGIRTYLSPESLFKFFLGVRAMLDLTPANGIAGWGDVDFGVRGEAGVQLDIVRYFGLYLQIGVNVTFLRSFAIAPDATGGLQVRFP